MEPIGKTALVSRSPDIQSDVLVRYWEGLDRLIFEPAVARGKQAAKEGDLLFAADAPLRRLIEQDESAVAALRELSELRKAALKERRTGSFFSWTAGISSFNLPLGIRLFVPPFDLDRPGPTAGSPVESHASRDTGEMFVHVGFDEEAHGFCAGTASLVMIFQPSVIGTLSVRPYVDYRYCWLVDGFNLSAHSEGSLIITAVREDDGQVQDSRTVQLWNFTTQSSLVTECDEDVAGGLGGSDFAVNFMVEPGRRYLVSISATVSGVQSGEWFLA